VVLPAPFPAEYEPLALAHAQTRDYFLTVAVLDWIKRLIPSG
jgi:hypothetical protein